MSENTSVEKWTKEQCVKFLRNVKGAKLTGNKCELCTSQIQPRSGPHPPPGNPRGI